MKKFTAVLMRDFRMSEVPSRGAEPETDSYLAFVEADSPEQAITIAKQQALAADTQDLGARTMRQMEFDTHSYTLIALFAGHQKAVLHGWQVEGLT